jgi:hypothetical protein
MKKVNIILKDGSNHSGILYSKQDYDGMIEFLFDIKKYNTFLNNLGGRKINVPDIVSEGIYCYLFHCARTNNSARSYDAVDIRTREGIQIKSASIYKDCTSFGLASTWDKLIFIDFHEFIDSFTNKVYFYHIRHNVHKLILNKSKNETFADQQKQGRRPRLSIRNIINENNLKPIKIIEIKK